MFNVEWLSTFNIEHSTFTLPLPEPTLTARLANELQIFDGDALLRAFAHVVDGQSGNGTGGHGLHLHACLPVAFDDRADLDRARFPVETERDVDGVDRDGMCERDERRRGFRRQDPGDLG